VVAGNSSETISTLYTSMTGTHTRLLARVAGVTKVLIKIAADVTPEKIATNEYLDTSILK
jgi:hypothetical protein